MKDPENDCELNVDTRFIENGEDHRLCVGCGICCDGTMFSSVRVVHADKSIDLPSGFSIGKMSGHFDQPCPALKSEGCSIYNCRPKVCREYDCGLLKRLKRGEVGFSEARKTVEDTFVLRDVVLQQLRFLFESNEGFCTLNTRFSELQASLNNKDSLDKAYPLLIKDAQELSQLLRETFMSNT